jgi:hypothetical protein
LKWVPRGFDLYVGLLLPPESMIDDCAVDHRDPKTKAVDLLVKNNSTDQGTSERDVRTLEFHR